MHKHNDYDSSDFATRYSTRRRSKVRKTRASRLKPVDMTAECCGYTIL